MLNLDIKVEIFREDDIYVAVCPSLNVSSYGETIERAKQALIEAIEVFVEECAEMGTLEDVLEESGFTRSRQTWHNPEPLKQENVALVI